MRLAEQVASSLRFPPLLVNVELTVPSEEPPRNGVKLRVKQLLGTLALVLPASKTLRRFMVALTSPLASVDAPPTTSAELSTSPLFCWPFTPVIVTLLAVKFTLLVEASSLARSATPWALRVGLVISEIVTFSRAVTIFEVVPLPSKTS